MVINSVKVFARLKKENELKEKIYDVLTKHPKYEDIVFHKGIVADTSAKFRFYQIFDQNTNQDTIFETIAKPVVSSVLQGFNGTVFAYGQTGSGKTYTMTGSTKRYQDRGIIPRSLQFIYSAIEKTEEKPTLYISYMEIYNEICYDLLHPKDSKTASRLEELPRVTVLEDKKGEACLRNLNVLPVSTEEEAMRLLFLGDTNRAIAETPLNEYSSRSHCIFTIYITSRSNNSQTLRYSKLNLVDLAGSERVYKSNITGTVLNEAKHINLSLHFLQQVILALSESKRLHIPYRNSLMTFILKDSLAGNCLTVMLATLAVSKHNLLETISTCKFAQRVSMIKTEPVINEVSDPYQEILLLRSEIQDLRKQLSSRNSFAVELETRSLTNLEKEECDKKLEKYLNNPDENFPIDLNANILQYCFSICKNKIRILEHQHLELNRSLKDLKNEGRRFPKNLRQDNSLRSEEQDDNLLEEFMCKPQNSEEINYYTKILSCTYEKAKILALTIEECQTSIGYIREKLNVTSNAGCSKQKMLLGRELEYQQQIYRKSLMELKELKQETMQLEAGLKKAKARMMKSFKEWVKCADDLKTQKHRNKCYEDQLKSNCSGHRSGKQWKLDLDIQSHQHELCRCKYDIDGQADFLAHSRYQQQYLRPDLEIQEDNLGHNSCFKGHYYNNDGLITMPDNCCVLEFQQSPKPYRNESSFTLLSQINSGDRRIKNSRTECTCNDICLSKTEENDKQIFNDACKPVFKNCGCRDSRYTEINYPRPVLSNSTEYSCNQIIQINSNVKNVSDIQCCFNKEHMSGCGSCKNMSFHHCEEHPNLPTDVRHAILTVQDNVGRNDVFPTQYSDDYSNLNSNNKPQNNTERNLTYDSSEEGGGHFDTQIIPIKLSKQSSIKEFSSKTTFNTIVDVFPNCQAIPSTTDVPSIEAISEETKTITSIPPYCQEKASGSCDLAKIHLHDANIFENNKNYETKKKQIKGTDQSDCKYMETRKSPNEKYDIFLESDTEDFRKYMAGIPLTGNEEIDKEICEFYRSKVCS